MKKNKQFGLNTITDLKVFLLFLLDNIRYPIAEPAGKKIYTEQYISDIGAALQIVTRSENIYTTQEMSQAILHHIPINGLYAIEFDLTFSEYTLVE